MNSHLKHLARRVADAPDFLACALAEYARSERLEDPDLAARLSCPVETLTSLRLCRMPRAQPPWFGQDVEQIALRFSVKAEVLAEIVRRGLSLFHLRAAGDSPKDESSYLLAARDDSQKQKPPEGAES
jgi:hypothetical protein